MRPPETADGELAGHESFPGTRKPSAGTRKRRLGRARLRMPFFGMPCKGLRCFSTTEINYINNTCGRQRGAVSACLANLSRVGAASLPGKKRFTDFNKLSIK